MPINTFHIVKIIPSSDEQNSSSYSISTSKSFVVQFGDTLLNALSHGNLPFPTRLVRTLATLCVNGRQRLATDFLEQGIAHGLLRNQMSDLCSFDAFRQNQ